MFIDDFDYSHLPPRGSPTSYGHGIIPRMMNVRIWYVTGTG